MAKKETFTRWDAAEYLKTEEDMALYLDAMIEESNGDPRMIPDLPAGVYSLPIMCWINSRQYP